jgi:hypothetical protein
MVQALINFRYIRFLSARILCEIQHAPRRDLFGVLPTFPLREYSYLHKPVSGVETDTATSRGALQKRQVNVNQKRQQASSTHVKDWLKRE